MQQENRLICKTMSGMLSVGMKMFENVQSKKIITDFAPISVLNFACEITTYFSVLIKTGPSKKLSSKSTLTILRPTLSLLTCKKDEDAVSSFLICQTDLLFDSFCVCACVLNRFSMMLLKL